MGVGRESQGREGDGGAARGGRSEGECPRDGEDRRLKVNKDGKGNVECRVRASGEYSNVTVSLKCCVGCLTSLILPKQTGLTWD